MGFLALYLNHAIQVELYCLVSPKSELRPARLVVSTVPTGLEPFLFRDTSIMA